MEVSSGNPNQQNVEHDKPSNSSLPPQQTFGKKTFAEILATAALGKSMKHQESWNSGIKPSIGLHKGKPSVSFSNPKISEYTVPYKWAIVGKFSQGRPLIENIHSFLVALDFKQNFQIGLLDSRHIIINFQSEEDYLRLFSRAVWYIGESVMRVFKWTHKFHVDKETSIVPIWVEFEKLPIFLFNREALFAIGSTIGTPLRLDEATAAIRKPSVARMQIEVDLLKERPDVIWIGLGEDDGFWQRVKYYNVPAYCDFCWHLGHGQEACHVKNPSLKVMEKNAMVPAPIKSNVQQVYRPK